MQNQTFTRLTVLSRAENAPGSRHSRWLCRCSCGRETTVAGHNLRTGKTRSCGCLRSEATAARSTCAARAAKLPNGTLSGDGLYHWGHGMPKTLGAICRKEKVNYLMVWRKAKTMGVRSAVYAARTHQLEKAIELYGPPH